MSKVWRISEKGFYPNPKRWNFVGGAFDLPGAKSVRNLRKNMHPRRRVLVRKYLNKNRTIQMAGKPYRLGKWAYHIYQEAPARKAVKRVAKRFT